MQQLQTQIGRRPSYAGGTILNLMILQRDRFDGADFSGICLWQVDLQHASLVKVDLSQADLTNTTFRQTFGRLETLVASPDGRWLAGGGERGDLRLYPLDESQPIVHLRGHTNTVRSPLFQPRCHRTGQRRVRSHDQDVAGGNRSSLAHESRCLRLSCPWPTAPTERWWLPVSQVEIFESGMQSPANLLAQIHGHTSPVMKIAFHPNGRYVGELWQRRLCTRLADKLVAPRQQQSVQRNPR